MVDGRRCLVAAVDGRATAPRVVVRAAGRGSASRRAPRGAAVGAPAYDPYSPTLVPTTPTPYTAPPPAYSPYAPLPYSPTPGAPFPDGLPAPQIFPDGGYMIGQPTRFLQELRLRDTQLLAMGSNSLSVNDVETSATFAIPFFQTYAPFLITPGFGMHFFGGPVTGPPDFADLPPRTYDAYIDAAWHPQVNPWLSFNLGVRTGVYTDFSTFNDHSIRIMGRGLAIVALTPTLQIAAGAVYLDRVLIKLLPAGGVIWNPNPDARYEILFPNPKLAHRWTTIGNTDVWVYVSGEYGGGSWTIQRINGNDQADYNDLRVNVGIETYGYRGLHAFFETGFAWDRKIVYRDSPINYNASDTVMLRGGVSY